MMQRMFVLTSLLVLLFAPACAPEKAPDVRRISRPTVLLTAAESWSGNTLEAFRDSLESTGHRVVVSGYAGETAADLATRLPWLLQPGTTLILYDIKLAGPAGADSLRTVIDRLNRAVEVREVSR